MREPTARQFDTPSRWRSRAAQWHAFVAFCLFAFSIGTVATPARGESTLPSLEDADRLFSAGRYEDCIAQCAKAISVPSFAESWAVLKARAELSLGQLEAAAATTKNARQKHPAGISLRLIDAQIAECSGDWDAAEICLAEIQNLAKKTPWRYTSAEDLVALGEAALRQGGDPNDVMESFFQRARKQNPQPKSALLAVGQLALELQDLELAVKTFEEAIRKFPHDADARHGLARALSNVEPVRSASELHKALEINPRHLPSLMMRIDQCVDLEEYAEAEKLLERVQKTNPKEPDAWAFRAVLAWWKNDSQAVETLLEKARIHSNPQADHLFGVKLSQKYQFTQGAAAQRRALKLDPEFIPARFQLAQDLLHLGLDEEGWKQLAEIQEVEAQHPGSAGLLELKERLAKFQTLENSDFVLRMETREAAVYGEQVLDLLGRAKKTLDARYGLKLNRRVTVEIFPDENDFALRAFGMPTNSGYLGVCFGTIIAANSPAGRGNEPLNWEAMLWHEYCHVVTLELTGHRIPRWFSEGISVYEERRQNSIWGQRITPAYRDLILNGELTPLRRMTAAFLHPKSPEHVPFAYYQASLVVEFLVDRHGEQTLQSVLQDLKNGLSVDVALERRTDGLERFETEFQQFARKKAEALATGADWTLPEKENRPTTIAEIQEWLKTRPNNIRALAACSELLLKDEQFDEALPMLQKLVTLDPSQIGPDCGWNQLAREYRRRGQTKAETAALQSWTQQDPSALEAILRLAELHIQNEHWNQAFDLAHKARAIDPMRTSVQELLRTSAEKCGDLKTATAAARAVIALEMEKTADAELRLAQLLHSQGDKSAVRHAVMALEISPRSRPAQRLLLEIRRPSLAGGTRGTELR